MLLALIVVLALIKLETDNVVVQLLDGLILGFTLNFMEIRRGAMCLSIICRTEI